MILDFEVQNILCLQDVCFWSEVSLCFLSIWCVIMCQRNMENNMLPLRSSCSDSDCII